MVILGVEPEFPPVHWALRDPNGLLAVGGDLSVARLRAAYQQGIFPWYSAGQPILWWSPDPRMILQPAAFSPNRALRKRLRGLAAGRGPFEIRVDTAVAQVLVACSASRSGHAGTWITDAMRAAYLAWHRAGQVHTIETWQDGQLVGGLYGVSLGGAFFGESMFHRVTDASKIALAYLVTFLRRYDVTLIDCQQDTPHMASMGARPIAREAFLVQLREALAQPSPPWRTGRLSAEGLIEPLTRTGIMSRHEPA